MGFSTIGMSHLSLQYYFVPVQVTKLGIAYNPTGDTVAFAFMPTPTQVPQNTDWVAGHGTPTRPASCSPTPRNASSAPRGRSPSASGRTSAYLKVTDNPEIPVEIVGQLQIS